MRKLPAMTSMELDDEEKFDARMPIAMPEKPQYPYGLRICLTEAEFQKLKIDPSEAEVGGTFYLEGCARITSVNKNESDDGEKVRVEAQIEDLSIKSEGIGNEKY